MKGIVLAGGAGSRLDPITRVSSKQLQPVYDKPMIYYPLATLMQARVRDILLVTTPRDLPLFQGLLGNGGSWGIRLSYATQDTPAGIAEALIIAATFAGAEPVVLVLGDNIFYGDTGLEAIVAGFDGGAHIFGYRVADPEAYGVIEVDGSGAAVSIEEKPAHPKSPYAVPGLYVYDAEAVALARRLVPSARGELEITDVNRAYLEQGRLQVHLLDRGVAWLDGGTHDSLLEAANFIATIERRQSIKVACLEEIAYTMGYTTRSELEGQVAAMAPSAYRDYLTRVLEG